MNPFDLRGPPFLVFYLCFAAATIVVMIVVRTRREGGAPPRIDLADPYLIATLRGGPAEAVKVAVTSMADRGLLEITPAGIAARPGVSHAGLRAPLERSIVDACATTVSFPALSDASDVRSATSDLEETLRRARLLPDLAAARLRSKILVAAMSTLAVVAGIKLIVAFSRGRTNVGGLIVLTIVGWAVAYWTHSPRRTALGDRVLADVRELYRSLRARAAVLQPGGATAELALLAATFGMGAVAWTSFPNLVAAREVLSVQAPSGSSCGSSCGTSCGSSCGSSCGGGGGGCGGCGS